MDSLSLMIQRKLKRESFEMPPLGEEDKELMRAGCFHFWGLNYEARLHRSCAAMRQHFVTQFIKTDSHIGDPAQPQFVSTK